MNYETAALELGADREAHRIALYLAPLTRLILAKECVERGLITTPEQYIRAVEGPKR